MRTALSSIVLAITLASCAGGGDDPATPVTPAEPNDTIGTASAVSIGTPIVATIATDGDVDFYAFTVPAGGANVRFQTFDGGGVACDPAHGAVDPYLQVFDAAGVGVNGADDGGAPPFCEDLTVALPAGTSYVMVAGVPPTPFTYTLKITVP